MLASTSGIVTVATTPRGFKERLNVCNISYREHVALPRNVQEIRARCERMEPHRATPGIHECRRKLIAENYYDIPHISRAFFTQRCDCRHCAPCSGQKIFDHQDRRTLRKVSLHPLPRPMFLCHRTHIGKGEPQFLCHERCPANRCGRCPCNAFRHDRQASDHIRKSFCNTRALLRMTVELPQIAVDGGSNAACPDERFV